MVVRTYNPRVEFLNEASKISTDSKYIFTTLDLECDTLALAMKDAMIKKSCIDRECWINSIKDFHGDKFTREKILTAIGNSEEDVKKGLLVQDMMRFFQRYNLQIGVYDSMYACIYQYNPQKRNHH
jgi:hypothetical protein